MNIGILIRWVLIFFSLIFFLIGGLMFYNSVSTLIDFVFSGEKFEFDSGFFIFSLILLIIGYFLFSAGFRWRKFFKGFSKFSVSIAVFCMSLFIIFYSINSHSDDIVDNIQPSLDYLVTMAIDDMFSESVEKNKGEEILISFSENAESKKFFASSIRKEDADLFSEELDFDNMNESEKIFITKFLVNEFYKEIKKQDKSLLDTPIPFETLKENMESMGVKGSFFENLLLLKKSYEIDSNAYITLSLAEETETESLIIGKITKSEANKIWKALDFETVSDDTKIKYSNIFLAIINDELKRSDLNIDTAIPLSSVANSLPTDIKILTSYDLFNDNTSIRIEEVGSMRSDCENIENNSEICKIVLLTEYDNLMSIDSNISKNISEDLPFDLANFQSINTEQKIEGLINEKTSLWGLFIFLWFMFVIIACGFYYIHLKINFREPNLSELTFYVSKANLINYVPAFLLFIVLYYFLISGLLIELLSGFFPKDLSQIIVYVLDMPIYQIFLQIFWYVIILNIFYFIFSIFFFASSYYFHKKNKKENDISNEESNTYEN